MLEFTSTNCEKTAAKKTNIFGFKKAIAFEKEKKHHENQKHYQKNSINQK